MTEAGTTPAEAIADVIRQGQRFLVVTHASADGDAIGSCLGLRFLLERMGKQAIVALGEPVPYRYHYLPGSDEAVQSLEASERFDVTVVLDVGSLERVGAELPEAARRGRLINIDHHQTNDGFAEATWCDPSASSVGEMIHALAGLLGIDVPAEAAEALFCAILTDTGSFRFGNTSPACLHAAADLVAAGARPQAASNAIFSSHPEGRLKLLASVLATLDLVAGGRIASVRLTREMLDASGGDATWADAFVDFPRSIAGVEVAILFREREAGEVKVSLRSKGSLDVARLAQHFGGGGHKGAAGAVLEGTLDSVRDRVYAKVVEAL